MICFLQILGLIVNIILATIAFWYALETRRLRKQATSQAATMEEELRLSVAPYLVPIVQEKDYAATRLQLNNNYAISPEQRQRRLAEVLQTNFMYACRVHNPTDKVATNLRLYIFDLTDDCVYLPAAGLEFLEPRAEEPIYTARHRSSLEEALQDVRSHYGNTAASIDQHLTAMPYSYMLLVYRDSESRVYLSQKQFEFTPNGSIIHHPCDRVRLAGA